MVQSGGYGVGKAGLFQEPLQLSSLMAHLASERTHSVRTYAEIGVYTCFTHVTMAAFLARISPLPTRTAAIDISWVSVSHGVKVLLPRHNVTLIRRTGHGLTDRHAEALLDGWVAHTEAHTGAGRNDADAGRTDAGARAADADAHGRANTRHRGSPSLVDLCFIDANHSYAAARADYVAFAPRCRSIMLHDIDATNLADAYSHAGGGGVPSLWQQLKASVRPHRLSNFTAQHAHGPGVFGLGLVAPGRHGTAEVDHREEFERWGEGEAAWLSMCRARPSAASKCQGRE